MKKDTFLSGSVFNALISFTLPVLGAQILQAAYGAVDLLVVGRYCSNACVGAVGTGTSIMHMATIVITALAVGSTVLIGRHIGEGSPEKAGRAAGTTVILFTGIALAMTALFVCFARPFALLMNITGEEAISECVTYVRICSAGIIIITAYNVISGVLRGAGNANLPFLFVGVACVVNIAGDIILVKYLGMRAAGAAIATVAAQGVSVIISLFVLKRQSLPIEFGRDKLRLDKAELKGILSVGWPIALEELLVQISFMVINRVANGISPEAPAAYAIGGKLVNFIMLIPSSMSQSVSAFTAQNFGAGQLDRAKRGLKTGILTGACVGVFICAAAILKGDLMCRLFTDGTDEETLSVIALAADYLKGFAPDCVLTSVLFCSIGYLNGLGRSIPVMLQGMTSAFLVRIPACLLFSRITSHTLMWVGLATPVTTVYGIAFFMCCFAYYRKKDRRNAA